MEIVAYNFLQPLQKQKLYPEDLPVLWDAELGCYKPKGAFMAKIQTNLVCWLPPLFLYPFLHLPPFPPTQNLYHSPLIKALLVYLTVFH